MIYLYELWNQAFPVIIGAALAAGFGIWQGRRLDKKRMSDRQRGIISALKGEVAVAAELVDVDADLGNLYQSDQLRLVGERLLASSKIYEACAEDLGLLPPPLPEQVVRFYGRLNAFALKAVSLSDRSSFFIAVNKEFKESDLRDDYARLRTVVSIEAENLLKDLHIREK